MEEVEKQDGAFRWLHHSIVECGGKPIGFCRYYACADSDELWEGFSAMGGSYSIDYLIGETGYLRRGIGRQIVTALTERIRAHGGAERRIRRIGRTAVCFWPAVLRSTRIEASMSRRFERPQCGHPASLYIIGKTA